MNVYARKSPIVVYFDPSDQVSATQSKGLTLPLSASIDTALLCLLSWRRTA